MLWIKTFFGILFQTALLGVFLYLPALTLKLVRRAFISIYSLSNNYSGFCIFTHCKTSKHRSSNELRFRGSTERR